MALTGKIAFVTGAGSGIGKAACLILARDGAWIVAADKNLSNVTETVNSIRSKFEGKHIPLELDVGNSSDIDEALRKILKEYEKPPSIVVNCAGIVRSNFFLELSEEDFDEVLKTNLKGVFLITQKFSNSILAHAITNASFINVGSITGKYGHKHQANYAASKAGVERLTRTASLELANKGIRFNAVLPGFILTPMTDPIPNDVRNKFLENVPIGRFGKAEEVAEVIAFLASDKSSYITGASIEVTGGY